MTPRMPRGNCAAWPAPLTAVPCHCLPIPGSIAMPSSPRRRKSLWLTGPKPRGRNWPRLREENRTGRPLRRGQRGRPSPRQSLASAPPLRRPCAPVTDPEHFFPLFAATARFHRRHQARNQQHSYHSMKTKFLPLFSGLVALGLMADHPVFAQSGERVHTRAGTWQSSRGGSGTFSETTTRGHGLLQRQGTWTNQNGGVGTHSYTRNYDKSTGTGTFTGSTTRPDGKTTSRDGTMTKNADGSVTTNGQFTHANGKVSDYTATTVKTADGRETTGTITSPNGKVSNLQTDVVHNDGVTTRDETITGPNGKTFTRDATTQVNPDGTGTKTI